MKINKKKIIHVKIATVSKFTFIKNHLVSIMVGLCIVGVGLYGGYKLFIQKPTYIYAKVKVGQGYWWASTQKPSMWFLKAIQNAKDKRDITGKPLAKIIGVTYYPYVTTGQYDVYVTVQLSVKKTKDKDSYSFDREIIGVGSPIDLEFPNVQFSGTLIDISDKPITDSLIEKTVYISKKYAYPWEYDEIQVGDTFYNGKEKVFEVLEKTQAQTNEVLLNDLGRLNTSDTETYKYILVKARVKLKQINDQFFYGEEILISPGRPFFISTDHITLSEYVIASIEQNEKK